MSTPFGCLPAPKNISQEDMKFFGPCGLFYSDDTAVEFKPPLLLKTLSHGRDHQEMILVDISDENVMKWKIIHLRRNELKTLGDLCQNFNVSIFQITVSVMRPDGDVAWYPWNVVNPLNFASYTIFPLDEKDMTCADSTEEILCSLSTRKDIGHPPHLEGSSNLPDSDGFITFDQYLNLDRVLEEAMEHYLCSKQIEDEEIQQVVDGMQSDFIGTLPSGNRDVHLTESDRKIFPNGNWKDYTVDKVDLSDVKSMRRFFYLYVVFARHLSDYRLPNMDGIIARKTDGYAGYSYLCEFRFGDKSSIVWVYETYLQTIFNFCKGFAERKLYRHNEDVRNAYETAWNYMRLIEQHKSGVGRAPSPGFDDPEDDDACDTGEDQIKTLQQVFRERAEEQICALILKQGGSMSEETIDKMVEERYRQLCSNDPEYKRIMMS